MEAKREKGKEFTINNSTRKAPTKIPCTHFLPLSLLDAENKSKQHNSSHHY